MALYGIKNPIFKPSPLEPRYSSYLIRKAPTPIFCSWTVTAREHRSRRRPDKNFFVIMKDGTIYKNTTR